MTDVAAGLYMAELLQALLSLRWIYLLPEM